jgi:DNA primase
MAADAVVLDVGSRQVRLSSPSRVLWPQLGITKLDLANYAIAVADAFLTANGDRPVALERYSEGVDGESFFSKNPPKGAPEWLRSVPVTFPSAR